MSHLFGDGPATYHWYLLVDTVNTPPPSPGSPSPASRSTSSTNAYLGNAELLVLMAVFSACSHETAGQGPTDSSGSESGGSTSIGLTTIADVAPDRASGCGDGIAKPGEYCFRAFSLPASKHDNAVVGSAMGLDFDGDGQDELVVEDLPPRNAVLRFDDGTFALGPEISSGASELEFAIPWDWDGDGLLDLVVPKASDDERVFVLHSLGDTLSDAQTEDVGTDFVVNGPPVPIDLGSDGTLDFIVAAEWPLDEVGAHLRTYTDGSWVDFGPVIPLPGCGATSARAHADFDGDGHIDVAIHDSVTGCKPYPTEYDPEFHRISIFTHDGEGGLRLSGTFPTGGWGETGFWADDFDGDGLVDVVIQPNDPPGVSLLLGRGDGTLEPPRVISSLPGISGPWRLGSRSWGDFDGDGDKEWLGYHQPYSPSDSIWIVDSLTNDRPAHTLPSWMPLAMTVADFNGDGIDDYLDHELGPLGEKLVLLSNP